MSRKNWSDEKIFTRLLTNKSKSTYWDNIDELRRRSNQYIYDSAMELVNTNKEKEMIIGLNILAQLGFPERFNQAGVISICFKLIENKQRLKVLEAVLYAISHNNNFLSDNQIETLVSYKNHKSVLIRYALVHTLLRIEKPAAIDALIELSRDKDVEVRDWATFGIGKQIEVTNKSIISALWNRIDDEYEPAREEAIGGLSLRKDKRVKEILIKELKDIDSFGSYLLESIEDFNDPDFIPLLEKQIEINKKTEQVNEKWLTNSLGVLKENWESDNFDND